MNILATIAARAGSKGVKSKNIREFLGWPLCAYTLSAYRMFLQRYASESDCFDLAVNTDSAELFAQLDQTGTRYLKIPRKDELAGDTAAKTDVIRDTLAIAEDLTGRTYDAVLDMDLTSPLRRAKDIKNILDAFFENDGAEIALSLTESRRNPYFNQLIRGDDGFFHIAINGGFVARQQAPEVFDANASLYVYSPVFLRGGTKKLHDAKLAASFMKDTAVLDIDSEHDFELLSLLADYFYRTDREFGEVREHIESFIQK